MLNENKLYSRYLFYFFIFSCILLVPIVLNIIFDFRVGENSSYKEISKSQQKNNSIYGSALNAGQYNYKLELAKIRKPYIVAIGSSRVLSFREEFFMKDFTNLGGVISNLTEGNNFVNQLYQVSHPKIVIIGVDYWWFNERVSKPNSVNDGTQLTYDKLINPIKWMLEGKIKPYYYFSSLMGIHINNNFFNFPTIGIRAAINGGGFRKDGSVHYGQEYFHNNESQRNIKEDLGDLFIEQLHDFRLRGNKPIEKFRLNEFKEMINILRKNGSYVIIFIPPVTPILAKKMRDDKYASSYMNDLIINLKKIIPDYPIYNYHNFDNYYNNDCEFIDAFHGGEVTYLRILENMAKQNEILAPIVNFSNLKNAKMKYADHSILILDKSLYKSFEYDFLGLKCLKNSFIESVGVK